MLNELHDDDELSRPVISIIIVFLPFERGVKQSIQSDKTAANPINLRMATTTTTKRSVCVELLCTCFERMFV